MACCPWPGIVMLPNLTGVKHRVVELDAKVRQRLDELRLADISTNAFGRHAIGDHDQISSDMSTADDQAVAPVAESTTTRHFLRAVGHDDLISDLRRDMHAVNSSKQNLAAFKDPGIALLQLRKLPEHDPAQPFALQRSDQPAVPRDQHATRPDRAPAHWKARPVNPERSGRPRQIATRTPHRPSRRCSNCNAVNR